MKFNDKGLITQYDGDTGDTCQREGLYIALLSLDNHNYLAYDRLRNVTLAQLQVAPGIYRRSSEDGYWGSNPNNLSRDQRAMLELAMAVVEDKKHLKEAAGYILKRGGFHQNTHPGTDAPADAWKIPDIVSPGELAVYIRGLNLWWLYPVLTVLDIGLIADIYTRSKWDGANMSAVNIIYANKKYPTVFSRIAARLCPKKEYINEITNYYSINNNGIPQLGEMYVKVINSHLSNN